MIVRITLPAETEQRLREAAGRRGQTLESYLEWLVNVSAGNGPPAERTTDQKVTAWHAWVESHASNPHVADDSRESIYGDRGE